MDQEMHSDTEVPSPDNCLHLRLHKPSKTDNVLDIEQFKHFHQGLTTLGYQLLSNFQFQFVEGNVPAAIGHKVERAQVVDQAPAGELVRSRAQRLDKVPKSKTTNLASFAI